MLSPFKICLPLIISEFLKSLHFSSKALVLSPGSYLCKLPDNLMLEIVDLEFELNREEAKKGHFGPATQVKISFKGNLIRTCEGNDALKFNSDWPYHVMAPIGPNLLPIKN